MDLSLQAIDFLLASSIQDGWPPPDCSADGKGGDNEGDEDVTAVFRGHLSSRGGVVHSARFSKNAAFSLTAPAHTARLPDCDGPSFSCTVVSFSPFPRQKPEARLKPM
ncbi:hypothetical protein F7725_002266 [Dissostichus mawsoni]|uniref:Uncharacterized protein n=1 Tax=Dissostichus mawsoni TaxID=36200 RepID=A0A7J5Y432_DISMA|nr:hypothetical protein F7725_002266 [Dissostichus mawsoni]